MHASVYVDALRQIFSQHADPVIAQKMGKYMRDLFPFYGIQQPQRKALQKQVQTALGEMDLAQLKNFVDQCFQENEKREMQYAVADWCAPRLREMDDSWIPFFTALIGRCSWWDSVDFLAPKLIGNLLLRYPTQMQPWAEQCIAAEDFWYQRAAIIFQLSYKEATRADLLFTMISDTKHSDEFFVQKGAGWALRQYAKIDPAAVQRFVAKTSLAPLTVREALKHLR